MSGVLPTWGVMMQLSKDHKGMAVGEWFGFGHVQAGHRRCCPSAAR